jgi:IclR family transcriptional regulator, pca regulon regulatory protein
MSKAQSSAALRRDLAGPEAPPPPGGGRTDDPNFMTSIARGLSVIRAFTAQKPNLTIAEVAKISGLPRAAARRCLYTLEQLGYAGADGRGFFLRPKILALGYAFLSSATLPQAIQPALEDVSAALQESASAAVLEDGEVIYIARAATKRIMSVDLGVGSRLPAYCTSLGRVLLAHLPPTEFEAYLEGVELKPLTERTITQRKALRRVVAQSRESGYSVVDQELEIGLLSVAVPIRSMAGEVVAAMNVSIQASRVRPGEIESRYLPILQAAAREASMSIARG